MSQDALPQLKALRHYVPKIWNQFKSEAAAPGMEHFDPVISSLGRFEELRYPDSILPSW